MNDDPIFEELRRALSMERDESLAGELLRGLAGWSFIAAAGFFVFYITVAIMGLLA